ncbi:MAG: 1-acyl-sn-glycerol-3-phosphate acyltransferase [Bacteroidota bacterium]
MFNFLCKYIFKILGWKVQGSYPQTLKKAIFIVSPHFVWFDFFVGLGSRATINLPIGYLGKKELFDNKFYGWFFYATGGHPVNRFSKQNAVESVTELFNENDTLYIAMAPEGTRKNVDKLRTGFYFIALATGVPLMFVGFEFPTKTVIFNETPFYVTGNFEADMEVIKAFYRTIKGKKKDWLLK